MLRLLIFSALFSFLLSSSAFAIGGDREGLTIGLGVGLAPVASYSLTGFNRSTHSTIAYTFSSGVGFSPTDALMFQSVSSIWKDNVRYWLNSTTVGWYHYFAETPGTFYVALGVGRMSLWENHDDASAALKITGENPKFGLGLCVGGGYEVRKRILTGLYLSHGRADDLKMTQLSLLLTYMAY